MPVDVGGSEFANLRVTRRDGSHATLSARAVQNGHLAPGRFRATRRDGSFFDIFIVPHRVTYRDGTWHTLEWPSLWLDDGWTDLFI
jgi:hypothetical protein